MDIFFEEEKFCLNFDTSVTLTVNECSNRLKDSHGKVASKKKKKNSVLKI